MYLYSSHFAGCKVQKNTGNTKKKEKSYFNNKAGEYRHCFLPSKYLCGTKVQINFHQCNLPRTWVLLHAFAKLKSISFFRWCRGFHGKAAKGENLFHHSDFITVIVFLLSAFRFAPLGSSQLCHVPWNFF